MLHDIIAPTSQLIHTHILHCSPAQGWGQVRSLGQLAAPTGVQNKRSLLTAGTKDPDTPTAEGARARPSGTNYQLHVAASQQKCEVLRFELENSFNLLVCMSLCVQYVRSTVITICLMRHKFRQLACDRNDQWELLSNII